MADIRATFRIQYELNADDQWIDLSWCSDPVVLVIKIKIQNLGSVTGYFKLVVPEDSPWKFGTDLATASNEKTLGGIDAQSSKEFTIKLVRAKPTSEMDETLTVEIQAYSDSNYTDYMGSEMFDIYVHFVDLPNWNIVDYTNFDDNDWNGWTSTNLSLASDRSVQPGYSAKFHMGLSDTLVTSTGSLVKTISTANATGASRVLLRVMFCYHLQVNAGAAPLARLDGISIKINDQVIYSSGVIASISALGAVVESERWFIICLDITDYITGSDTIAIEVTGSTRHNVVVDAWFDEILIAYK